MVVLPQCPFSLHTGDVRGKALEEASLRVLHPGPLERDLGVRDRVERPQFEQARGGGPLHPAIGKKWSGKKLFESDWGPCAKDYTLC